MCFKQNYNGGQLVILNPDISCFENSVHQDKLASKTSWLLRSQVVIMIHNVFYSAFNYNCHNIYGDPLF